MQSDARGIIQYVRDVQDTKRYRAHQRPVQLIGDIRPVRAVRLALMLAHAQNRSKARADGGIELRADFLVALAHGAALRVADYGK